MVAEAPEKEKQTPFFKAVNDTKTDVTNLKVDMEDCQERILDIDAKLTRVLDELAAVRAQLHTKSTDALVRQINRLHDFMQRHMLNHA